MATISKIEIEGFKAFPKYFSLELGNHSLLMYGENGSGKSSIYHALHALLQSVFKDDKGAKYFKVVEDSSTGEGSIPNNENLINISRTNEARDGSFRPYVKITLDNGHIWELDRGGLQINGGDDSEIRMMNKDAVFINHSYISRFHSARNSEDINLWSVFYKDILPFYLPATRNQFLATTFDEIYNESKSSPTPTASNKKYQSKIINFNSDLEALINDANLRISNIYNEYLRNEDEDELEIKLHFFADDSPYNNTHDFYYLFYGKKRNGVSIPKKLYLPTIGLNIKEGVKEIHKPQTHFNEAKLTAIALAVRFACLPKNVGEGAFMALDDMLISLDMSNRMKVVNYLLDVVVKKYKVYLFTHDKLFYETLKKRIEIEKMQGEWLMGGLYMHDVDEDNDYKPCLPYPKFIIDKDKHLEMMEYYAMHDYPACGLKLRKWCEELLDKLLPDTLKKVIDSQTGNTVEARLNDKIRNLQLYCEKETIDYTQFKNLKIYKDNVLNTVSHYDIESPIYKEEVLNTLKVLNELQKLVTERREILVHKDLGIDLIKPDGVPVTICFSIKGTTKLPLLYIGNDYRISYFVKCTVKKLIISGVHNVLPMEEPYDSIYDVYKKYCTEYGLPGTENLLDITKDRGTKLRNKI